MAGTGTLILVVCALLVAGIAATLSAAGAAAAPPLRELAKKRGILIGACASSGLVGKEPEYWSVFAREFDVLTPENAFKWGPLSNARGQYDFRGADALADFAEKHGIAVHGHTLVWHNQLPKWVAEGTFTRDEALAVMREHIDAVAGHFKGRVAIWDVVNEAFEGKSLRESVWMKSIGPDYIEQAFRMAHAADPKARLVYNDYGNEAVNPKSDAIYAHLKGLIAKGVPVHGIGFQFHIEPGGVEAASFKRNLRRFAELGLELYVTELDVRLKDPPTEADLKRQADTYREILDACLAEPSCKAFQLWGFTDRHSWIPGHFKGTGSALIFDAEYRPKPAYEALRECLKRPAL